MCLFKSTSNLPLPVSFGTYLGSSVNSTRFKRHLPEPFACPRVFRAILTTKEVYTFSDLSKSKHVKFAYIIRVCVQGDWRICKQIQMQLLYLKSVAVIWKGWLVDRLSPLDRGLAYEILNNINIFTTVSSLVTSIFF